jgi:hypothetical protein
MRPVDTSEAAAALQDEAYRRIGETGRFRVALELSDFTHALALAGIRSRHPELSEAEARQMLAAQLYHNDAP